MADKYFALMGGDKAWKQDAADMAMLASAKLLKPGATVKSGLGEFMEAESAKGPGRAETIRKDATKLAITQDIQMDFLQKKHTLYKNKGLTLKGQVKLPELSASWDPKNKSFSSFGSPQLGLTNKANVSGSYKLGKKATLSGGVNWETGQKPKYNVGLNINI